MKAAWKWISLAVLVILAAAPATAQHWGAGPGAGWAAGADPGWAAAAPNPAAPAALKEFLGLTDQQVQQLTDLRRQAAEDNRSLAEQIRAKWQELDGLLKQTSPDPVRIGQIHLEIKRLNDQRLARLERLRTQTQAVLTAQQRQKLAELEKALQLGPAARQAVGLGLIAPPDPPAGAGAGFGPRALMRGARPARTGGGWI